MFKYWLALTGFSLCYFIAFNISSTCESATSEDIEAGKKIYEKKCQYCHGITGKGDGPASDFLNPKPRDFTSGLYKIRSTPHGELPTDEDIFNIITNGMFGTSMPAWTKLSEKERLQLVYYIKTFSDRFKKEKPGRQISFGKEPSFTSQSIKKGEDLYKRMKCFLCHGDEGKGDGVITTTLWNEWRIPFYARNFTKAWTFKGGNSTKDIYRTISTGMNGAPMGAYLDYLNEEERWDLAYYVKNISKEEISPDKVVLKSKLAKGSILPEDLNDPFWDSADSITISLTGQVTAIPRWQNQSVDSITIRSFYNEKEIVFLLEWDDRTKNIFHKEIPRKELIQQTYPEMIFQPQDEIFQDAVGIQFPVKIQEGSQKPYFILGDIDKPVIIWKWKAELQVVEELIATGYNAPIQNKSLDNQNLECNAVGIVDAIWSNGKWKVMMKRNLKTTYDQDINFEQGKLIPFLFYVWDGSNNEKELKSSISSWYYLMLEKPLQAKVYIYPVLAFIFAIGFEFWFIRKVRKKK